MANKPLRPPFKGSESNGRERMERKGSNQSQLRYLLHMKGFRIEQSERWLWLSFQGMFSPLFSHQQKAAIQTGRGGGGVGGGSCCLPSRHRAHLFSAVYLSLPPLFPSPLILPPNPPPPSQPPSLQRFQAWTGG